MMLATASGQFPIPPEVARRLPVVPDAPAGRDDRAAQAFYAWLEASPDHMIAFERLRRWRLVQEDLAARAARAGLPFEVTADGLE